MNVERVLCLANMNVNVNTESATHDFRSTTPGNRICCCFGLIKRTRDVVIHGYQFSQHCLLLANPSTSWSARLPMKLTFILARAVISELVNSGSLGFRLRDLYNFLQTRDCMWWLPASANFQIVDLRGNSWFEFQQEWIDRPNVIPIITMVILVNPQCDQLHCFVLSYPCSSGRMFLQTYWQVARPRQPTMSRRICGLW